MDAFVIEQPGFGVRLRELRTAHGLSQRDLAGETVNPSYVSLIESGARVPTLDVAVRLAATLGTALEDLVGGRATSRTVVRDPATLVAELLAGGSRDTGDLADAERRFRVAYDAARADGDAVASLAEGWALLDVLGRRGDLPGRLRLSAELVELADGVGAVDVSVRTWVDRAAALRDDRRLVAAKDLIDRARAAVGGTAIEDTGEHVRLLGVAVSVVAELGEQDEIAPAVAAMLALAETIDSVPVLGRALWAAGLAQGQLGDATAAAQSMSRAAGLLSTPSTSLGDWGRFNLAAGRALLDADGNPAPVRRHLGTARTALSLVDLPAESAALQVQLARVELRDEAGEQALDLLDQVDVDALEPGDVTAYWSVRAEALEAQDRSDDAAAALRRAVELAEAAGAYRIAAGFWREIDRLRR